MKRSACLAAIALAVLPALAAAQDKTEPRHVTVQHILIAFRGSLPGDQKVTRGQAEAEKLALRIFERAKAGEDFDLLVKTFTNDEYPGIYSMSNRDVTPDPAKHEYPRAKMVKAFGDVSFGLEVGGVGLAVYDPATSKYGWHIIKRLQ
jgi:hypothetical protein